MSQTYRLVMSIYKRVCKGYKSSGQMDKPVSGTRSNVKVIFGILFAIKAHYPLVQTVFYCEHTTIKIKLLI